MFRSVEFLKQQSIQILEFYRARCIDPQGGYFQNYLDSGEVFDPGHKHLVSSTRMMFNFYRAWLEFGEPWMLEHARHGYAYLRDHHRRSDAPGFVWQLQDYRPENQTQYCYGYAFVVLALSAAVQAGEPSAKDMLYATWELWEQHFWQPEQGIYADEISADWQTLSSYRGQNANMHACEALLSAYEATRDQRFLVRAEQLAQMFVNVLAGASDGLIWEHYHPDLSPDLDYNRDDPKNLYKPWGFQPGHQTEWSKLLLMLNRHRGDNHWLPQAEFLFQRAVEIAWDHRYGGLFYGFAPDQTICDPDKYFWVQAESFAAAAMLAVATGKAGYWEWYEKLWQYCWDRFVDHRNGAWFRILSEANGKLTDRKSEAGSKCDYHNLNAILEALKVLAPDPDPAK